MIAFLMINPIIGSAQDKPKKTETVTFFVNGDCDMCADRIEAACDLKGVIAAEYVLDTYTLTLTYKPSKISLDKIHDAIAAAGYDTSERKASQESYDALPGCCQYDRTRQPKGK
ncbi:MAG: hypothetical protein RL220_1821 [Bacteroidota bacterium]